MGELVFCCPQCLHIASTGIVTDIATMMRAQHRPIFVMCWVCRSFNCILVEDALVTESLDASGNFIPLERLQVSDAAEAADASC
jgi:hypothetical protein